MEIRWSVLGQPIIGSRVSWQGPLNDCCQSRSSTFYFRGTLDGRKAWTPHYRRPKKRSAEHFCAINKRNGNVNFLKLQYLIYCSNCKDLSVAGVRVAVDRYLHEGTPLSYTFVLTSEEELISLSARDNEFKSCFFFQTEIMLFLSVVSHVTTSD